MPEASTATPDNPSERANVGARRQQIVDAARQIHGIESQRDAAREVVKGFNKRISDIHRQLKSDLGLDRQNTEFILGIVQIEEQQKKDRITDQLREIWEALQLGEQADFLGIIGSPNDEAASFSPTEISVAREKGRTASEKGKSREKHPYPEPHRRKLLTAWLEGWDESTRERVAAMGTPSAA